MGEWQSVDVAPREVPLIVRTERGRIFKACIRYLDDECGYTWATPEEHDVCPDDWTDGVCWTVSADGERSDWPVEWMHMPAEQDPPQDMLGKDSVQP